ncbi:MULTISPECIES: HalOD1 output domain-containing protein [Natrialbaceae]|uniref:HalOD1 output domain-containing protein n=1 Tax=Natrialbaceae TaxID=1644061 RepID=UPI00207C6C4D|nr:HalOD1 output domain-containing protein [Natronococcus sp. CG52]
MNDNTTTPDSTPVGPFDEDGVGHDPATEASHARFDTEYNTVVVTIVETVAAVTNREPAAMEPLFAAIDPESLTGLVASTRKTPVEVGFSYEGCRVTVSSRGTVVVEQPDE